MLEVISLGLVRTVEELEVRFARHRESISEARLGCRVAQRLFRKLFRCCEEWLGSKLRVLMIPVFPTSM